MERKQSWCTIFLSLSHRMSFYTRYTHSLTRSHAYKSKIKIYIFRNASLDATTHTISKFFFLLFVWVCVHAYACMLVCMLFGLHLYSVFCSRISYRRIRKIRGLHWEREKERERARSLTYHVVLCRTPFVEMFSWIFLCMCALCIFVSHPFCLYRVCESHYRSLILYVCFRVCVFRFITFCLNTHETEKVYECIRRTMILNMHTNYAPLRSIQYRFDP